MQTKGEKESLPTQGGKTSLESLPTQGKKESANQRERERERREKKVLANPGKKPERVLANRGEGLNESWPTQAKKKGKKEKKSVSDNREKKKKEKKKKRAFKFNCQLSPYHTDITATTTVYPVR